MILEILSLVPNPLCPISVQYQFKILKEMYDFGALILVQVIIPIFEWINVRIGWPLFLSPFSFLLPYCLLFSGLLLFHFVSILHCIFFLTSTAMSCFLQILYQFLIFFVRIYFGLHFELREDFILCLFRLFLNFAKAKAMMIDNISRFWQGPKQIHISLMTVFVRVWA